MLEGLKFGLEVTAILLKQFIRILIPVAIWTSIGLYLGFQIQAVLLSFIAVSLSAFAVIYDDQRPKKPEMYQADITARDFYVVTNASYEWDIANSGSRRNVEPNLGAETVAFSDLEAAIIKYKSFEVEHEPASWENTTLADNHHVKHKGWHSHYEEAEARLYVVSAQSKPEAYDMIFYDDKRKLVTYDERRNCLLMATNNRERQAAYLSWWHSQRRNRP